VIVTGTVYHLSQASDFAGTYVRVRPEAVHGRGGAGMMFQNESNVVLHLTRIQNTREHLGVQFPGDRLTIESRLSAQPSGGNGLGVQPWSVPRHT
jgi:hypothetical protein